MRGMMMRRLLVATLFSAAACQQQASPLDSQIAASAHGKGGVGAGPVGMVEAPSGDLASRVAALEATNAKYAEALGFLQQVYSQQKAQQEAQEEGQPAPDAVFAVAVGNSPVDGPKEGTLVTIVEGFDFACPYCQKASGTMEELVKEYGGKVRVVFKNMVVHPQVATTAHLASCGANKQGKYNEYKHAIWEKAFLPYAEKRDPTKLGEENLMAIAKELQLDTAKLKTDMGSDDCKKWIADDMAEMQKFKVNSTPTFFINGQEIPGALPKEEFKKIIDEKIKVAEASGVPAKDYYEKEIMGKGEQQFRSKKQPKPN
jgi:protein-disulfide isomerase